MDDRIENTGVGIRCGIDLGTTHSSIAYLHPNAKRVQPVWLRCNGASDRIRSVICLQNTGKTLTGEVALNVGALSRETTTQTDLGFSISEPRSVDGLWARDRMPMFLKTLLDEAEAFSDKTVDKLVLAIPSCCPEDMVAGMKEAVRRANLPDVSIVPDLWAAAWAVAEQQQDDVGDQYLLIVNIGATVCETGLVRVTSTDSDAAPSRLDVQLLCHRCNASLGGDCWTEELARLARDMTSHSNALPYDQREPVPGLRERSEAAKRQLTQVTSVDVVVENAASIATISREQFEEETAHHLNEVKLCINEVVLAATCHLGVEHAGIRPVLVGGPTRMPAIQRLVYDLVGDPVIMSARPEDIVATGAALAVQNMGDPSPSWGVDLGSRAVVALNPMVDQSMRKPHVFGRWLKWLFSK